MAVDNFYLFPSLLLTIQGLVVVILVALKEATTTRLYRWFLWAMGTAAAVFLMVWSMYLAVVVLPSVST